MVAWGVSPASPPQHHCGLIRNGDYSFIWIRIPGKVALPRGKRERFNSIINSWMSAAVSTNVLAVHCARTWDKYEGKDHWACYDDSFRLNKFESEHHMCHFEANEAGKQGPSNIIYRMLSTAEVPSHPCKFPGKEHFNDKARSGQEGTSSIQLQADTFPEGADDRMDSEGNIGF